MFEWLKLRYKRKVLEEQLAILQYKIRIYRLNDTWKEIQEEVVE